MTETETEPEAEAFVVTYVAAGVHGDHRASFEFEAPGPDPVWWIDDGSPVIVFYNGVVLSLDRFVGCWPKEEYVKAYDRAG